VLRTACKRLTNVKWVKYGLRKYLLQQNQTTPRPTGRTTRVFALYTAHKFSTGCTGLNCGSISTLLRTTCGQSVQAKFSLTQNKCNPVKIYKKCSADGESKHHRATLLQSPLVFYSSNNHASLHPRSLHCSSCSSVRSCDPRSQCRRWQMHLADPGLQPCQWSCLLFRLGVQE